MAAVSVPALPVLGPDFDLSSGVVDNPSWYNVVTTAPTIGGTTPLNVGGDTLLEFELPIDCVMNLHKSSLTGTISFPAPNAGQAGFIHYIPPFNRVELVGNAGAQMLVLPNAQQYFRLVRQRRLQTGYEKLKMRSFGGPAEVPLTDTQAIVPVPTTLEDVISDRTFGLVPPCQLESREAPRILISRPVNGGTIPSNQPLSIPFDLRLSEMCPDSIFGLTHDMHFRETVRLRLTIPAANTMMWCATGQGDSQAGATAQVDQTMTLTGFRLKVQMQQNTERIAFIRRALKPGFYRDVPYPLVYTNTIATGTTSLAADIRVGNGLVSEIRDIFWGMSGVGSAWRLADFSNIDANNIIGAAAPEPYQRLLQYTTTVDSKQLQGSQINCTKAPLSEGPYTDYFMNDDGKSPQTITRLTFQQSWCHRDSFQSLRETGSDIPYSIPRAAIYGGLKLKAPGATGSSIQYKINGNMKVAGTVEPLTLYLFAICTGTVKWDADQMMMVS